MQHRGEIIRKVVLDSGYSITKLAERLAVSRRTVYNYFENPKVPMDTILEIGKIIGYDFRKDIKDLKGFGSGIQNTEDAEGAYSVTYWKDRYYQLLEEHKELLSEIARKKTKPRRRGNK